MSFMDTANSVISKAFVVKDSLICIDDYKPSNRSDVNTMEKRHKTSLGLMESG